MSTTPTDVKVARFGALLIPLLLAAACGGERGSDVLSPQAVNGRQIANTSGCASCHGADGSGGVGPAFVGLYGSEVQLTDGSTVVADDEYLRRSIVDPSAQLTDGYTLRMPEFALSDEEVDDVLAYIRELGSDP